MFSGKNLLLPSKILSSSWIKVIMQGDIDGYFGALLQMHSKAPSFKLNALISPQILQKLLVATHNFNIDARDTNKKLF
jgi:hypothetical protein